MSNNRKGDKRMNLIPMIARELGVEIGEEFELTGYGAMYCIKEQGICYYDKQRKEWTLADDYVFVDILRGVEEIKKLPFKPKRGEEFYKVCVVGGKLTPCVEIWADYLVDYALKYCGNCFRTKAEAEKHKYEIYEKITGRKWEEHESTD